MTDVKYNLSARIFHLRYDDNLTVLMPFTLTCFTKVLKICKLHFTVIDYRTKVFLFLQNNVKNYFFWGRERTNAVIVFYVD